MKPMKKIMLIGMVTLLAVSFDVGKASNVSPTAKVLVTDDLDRLINEINAFDGIVLVISDNGAYAFKESVDLTVNPVGIAPAPVELDLNRPSSYIDYKQNGKLKAKFHSWYLFNPLKLC